MGQIYLRRNGRNECYLIVIQGFTLSIQVCDIMAHNMLSVNRIVLYIIDKWLVQTI